jgi:hypothetical protein
VDDYRFLTESFIIPALGDVRLARLVRPGLSLIEKFYAELRRCRRRCDGKPFIEHRKGCPSGSDPDYQCDKRCKFDLVVLVDPAAFGEGSRARSTATSR